jgi:aconitase B
LLSNFNLYRYSVAEKSTVVSTSTRNFPNRLGKGANVVGLCRLNQVDP